ncbi:hypothetical protein [Streptomyces sp. NPDC051572]|uniref:hypothetical protein n=1 Tax=Streptomyces sp. NPDC051572 TaxID=3155802 RepID=UPI00344EDA44
MHTISRNDSAVIDRLRKRLTDVRRYDASNDYAGSEAASEEAWTVFDSNPNARLVQLNALLGEYMILVGDQHWYGLSPAMEFIPDAQRLTASDGEEGDATDPASVFERAVEGRNQATHTDESYAGPTVQAALTLIVRSVRGAHPDAVLLELDERGDDYEEHGFLPDRALRADGTEILLAEAFVEELMTYTVEFDGAAEGAWRPYIHDIRGPRRENPFSARRRTFVIDLRAHGQQPTGQPSSV